MECKITSTPSNKRACAAFTLVEMMVAAGLGLFILAAFLWTSVFTARSFSGLQNYLTMEQRSRNSLDEMSRDIRQTDYLSNYTTTALYFQTTDPTTSNVYILSYVYDTNGHTLTRKYGTNSSIVLSNCNYFHFDVYQRNPALTNGGNLQALINTNQPSLVKAIDFTWTIQDTLSGTVGNSDDVSSARVVIRKD